MADIATELDLPIDGADVVVHIAGEKRDVSLMRSVNADGTNNLLAWASNHGVKRFVLVSSVGVYGAEKHSGIVTESFRHAPANGYEATKEEGERNTVEVCRASGIDCVILQPSNVIGLHEGGDAFPLLGFMRSISRRLLVQFTGDAWMNYVAVDDVARALYLVAASTSVSGTFILNESISLSEVVRTVAATLETRAPTVRLPVNVGLGLGELGSVAERVLRRSLPVNRERIRELTNTTRYDGSALQRAIGYRYESSASSTLASMAVAYAKAGLL